MTLFIPEKTPKIGVRFRVIALFCLCCALLAIACSGIAGSGRTRAEAGLEAESRKPVPPAVEQKKPESVYSPEIVAAGRALEAGDAEKAAALAKGAEETGAVLLLLARIAKARGEFEAAVGYYRRLADLPPDLETLRTTELAEALAAAGKPLSAAEEVARLLAGKPRIDRSQRLSLLMKQAGWWIAAGKPDQAAAVYEGARKAAETREEKDRIEIPLAGLLLDRKDKARAAALLRPLSLDASNAWTMQKALALLEEAQAPLAFTPEERLARARVLIAHRAWKDALDTLEPLPQKGPGALASEACWLRAQILFKKRRQYKEAEAALRPIAQARGPHADEAGFLLASAFSRLDRDKEAIKIYRTLAAKTKDQSSAALARFQAARLEFYLGQYGASRSAFEKLAGTGLGEAKSRLSPDDEKEAHFLSGLSALLENKPARAESHFAAASRGAGSPEALARNRYWLGVAQVKARKKEGPVTLRGLCADDPTAWYALLADQRLADLGEERAACALAPLKPEAAMPIDAKPLEEISPTAAFLASVGFFREAAAELRKAEKQNPSKAEIKDWVASYLILEAPHHALRRAAAGFRWPPDPAAWWRTLAAYPSPYEPLVQEVEQKHNLPRGFVYAIAHKESGFRPDVVSSAGALGLMQMMPHTYEVNRKRAGLPARKDGEIPAPEPSIRAAAFELSALMARFHGSLPLAIMGYNGGEGAVDRWLKRSGELPTDLFVEKVSFTETRNYVRRVFGILTRYRLLAGLPPLAVPRKITGAEPSWKARSAEGKTAADGGLDGGD